MTSFCSQKGCRVLPPIFWLKILTHSKSFLTVLKVFACLVLYFFGLETRQHDLILLLRKSVKFCPLYFDSRFCPFLIPFLLSLKSICLLIFKCFRAGNKPAWPHFASQKGSRISPPSFIPILLYTIPSLTELYKSGVGSHRPLLILPQKTANNRRSNDYNRKHLYERTNLYKQTLIYWIIELFNEFEAGMRKKFVWN